MEEQEVEAASIPPTAEETPSMINGPNLNPATITVCRKIAKRSEAWYNDPEMPPPPLRIPARRSWVISTSTFQGISNHRRHQDVDEDMPVKTAPLETYCHSCFKRDHLTLRWIFLILLILISMMMTQIPILPQQIHLCLSIEEKPRISKEPLTSSPKLSP
jgi:hypothetical protein